MRVFSWDVFVTVQWRRNERDGVSDHQPHDCLLKRLFKENIKALRLDCLLNRLFRRRSKKISKLCVTGLCEGNSPVTGEFPIQRASNAEDVSIWWRHHAWTNSRSLQHVRSFISFDLLRVNAKHNTMTRSLWLIHMSINHITKQETMHN